MGPSTTILQWENDPPSWSTPVATPTVSHYLNSSTHWEALTDDQMTAGPPLAPQDPGFVHSALQRLRQVAPAALEGDRPFFLALGTLLPHVPQKFPQRFLDLYPEEAISETDNGFAPYDMPDSAWYAGQPLLFEDIVAMEIPGLGSVNVTLPAQKVDLI